MPGLRPGPTKEHEDPLWNFVPSKSGDFDPFYSYFPAKSTFHTHMLHNKLSQLLAGTGTMHANTLPHSNWTILAPLTAKIPPPPTLPLRSYVALLRETYASHAPSAHTTSRAPLPHAYRQFSAPYLEHPILAGPEKKRHTFQIRARCRAESEDIHKSLLQFLRTLAGYRLAKFQLTTFTPKGCKNSLSACWRAPSKSHVGALARV